MGDQVKSRPLPDKVAESRRKSKRFQDRRDQGCSGASCQNATIHTCCLTAEHPDAPQVFVVGSACVSVCCWLCCCVQFEFELSVARMVLGPDADVLGGLLANSSGWLGASDETHCGKMATLKVRCC